MPTNQLLIASRTMEKKSFQQCSISDNRRRGLSLLNILAEVFDVRLQEPGQLRRQ